MQQENLGFHPLAQHMPYKVSKYANQDIYVKEDDLKENFGKLRKILCDNFCNMQASRIELKKGFDEKKCNNVDDINVEKNVYFVIFPTGERISFSPSGITASNGAAITSKNARNLYGSEEFESCFADAVLTNNPTALFNLLQRYSKKIIQLTSNICVKIYTEKTWRQTHINQLNKTTIWIISSKVLLIITITINKQSHTWCTTVRRVILNINTIHIMVVLGDLSLIKCRMVQNCLLKNITI